jgi:RimJ/RimL family protein N-acetyltransferase
MLAHGIRKASVEDAVALWQAEVETAKTPGLIVSRPDELVLETFVKKVRELSAAGSYVVAEDDGTLIGHAFLERMPLAALHHVARLTVVVHPGQTARGVGAALVQHLQHWANAQHDVYKIELLVRSTNTRALSLYRRLGFIEEGRLKGRVRLPDGQLVDDVTMAWFAEMGLCNRRHP